MYCSARIRAKAPSTKKIVDLHSVRIGTRVFMGTSFHAKNTETQNIRNRFFPGLRERIEAH
jgi:hypothetical protein